MTDNGRDGELLRFRYQNLRRQVLDRSVILQEELPDHFIGFCLLRQDRRTFRKRRVLIWYDETDRHLITPGGMEAAPKLPPDDRLEILFTGFASKRRAELELLAAAAGYNVRKTVTRGLDCLCAGPNAGPAKLSAARDLGADEVSETDFLALIQSPAADTPPEKSDFSDRPHGGSVSH